MKSKFFLLIAILVSGCNNESKDAQKHTYPRIVVRYGIEELFEKSILDYYLLNCDKIYFSRINDSNPRIDSSKILKLMECNVSLDSLIKVGNSIQFYYSLLSNTKPINRLDWKNGREHPISLTYRVCNGDLIEIGYIGYSARGLSSNFDSVFRLKLLDSTKEIILSSNRDKIDSNIYKLLRKYFPLSVVCD
jgi:hypothetical protein